MDAIYVNPKLNNLKKNLGDDQGNLKSNWIHWILNDIKQLLSIFRSDIILWYVSKR